MASSENNKNIDKSSELISNYDTPSEEEMAVINKHIPIKEFKKGTLLLKEGQIATESYFVIKGLIRSFYLVDGNELTTSFYSEDQSCAAMDSYINQKPASHYLECVEDCTLSVLSYQNEKELSKKYPKFESLCRNTVEEDYGKQQELLANFITKSPEERYLHLLNTRPELLNRVPQYHLASYLGVKPESLSRIRKRIADR